MAVVTPFPGLNRLLGELVVGAKIVLGANFIGAYLQGSFAVGDADEFSDVDFIVVTHDPLTGSEQAGLQKLHARLHELDDAWGRTSRVRMCRRIRLDVRSRESFVRYQQGDGLAFGRWKQPYLVLSICRMHQTMERGVVTSKRQADAAGR